MQILEYCFTNNIYVSLAVKSNKLISLAFMAETVSLNYRFREKKETIHLYIAHYHKGEMYETIA